jgi:hypothetical protein
MSKTLSVFQKVYFLIIEFIDNGRLTYRHSIKDFTFSDPKYIKC